MTRSSAARWLRTLIITMPDYPGSGRITLNHDEPMAAKVMMRHADDAVARLRR